MAWKFPRIVFLSIALCAGTSAAQAADCPGNPNAIGTSRTIVVDPSDHTRIGTMDYAETLPLARGEVVLTFDDGPLPPYTNQVLKTLASECVLATYFIVGQMARAYPEAVRNVHAAGHTIGTHSWGHPLKFRALSFEQAKMQVDRGIAATAVALGDASQMAPFFRFPGFGHTNAIEEYLAEQGIMVWGADAPADDWHKITANEIARRAIRRLEAKGKGILLLHDIHARTVEALPIILRELKDRGFRIVHVVPASPERPATETVASAWRLDWRPRPAAPVIKIASVQDLDAGSLAKLNIEQLCVLPEAEERVSRRIKRVRVQEAALHTRNKTSSVHVKSSSRSAHEKSSRSSHAKLFGSSVHEKSSRHASRKSKAVPAPTDKATTASRVAGVLMGNPVPPPKLHTVQ